MKISKKILSMTMIVSLLSVCIAIPSFAANEKTTTIKATPTETTVTVGDTFDVEFSIEGNPGITQIVLNIAQVDGLTIISTEDICTVSGFDDNRNSTNLARNPFQLDLCNSDAEDATGDGKLYKVTYKADKAGEYEIKITPDEVYDANETDVTTTTNNVKVTVESDEPVTPPATTVEKAAKATTPFKTGLKGIKFFVTTDDDAVVNKTAEKVVEFQGTTFVEGGDVSVGLKVTGVPSTVNLTITAEDWYGNN